MLFKEHFKQRNNKNNKKIHCLEKVEKNPHLIQRWIEDVEKI